MTTVIDERVVEMRFDNEQFEKNVAQSMSTLDKLKAALNFKSGDSLENLAASVKGFSLDNVSESISQCTTKFSALEIAGITALSRITNKAIDMASSLVKSLSIDQVTAGFDKYAEKTTSVQTIMAATAKDFSNQAEQMEYVNAQLEKLTWFTDETSYNMLDMVSNIGKFTSNNVKLDTAVTAMEGIANWAAISGANATEASRAMYNFSQALGAGAMKLQDWKSIENANMATWDFKQVVVDTAVELGTLKKVSNDTFSTIEGKTFTLKEFSTQLKSGWFTSDVMLKSLEKYGGFTDELYKMAEATGYTASELLGFIDKYKAGTLDITKVSDECGVSVSELSEAFAHISDETYEMGIKSFKAAQEAKTFAEAINATKDAVSSQWMSTFEMIFGNYQEAKALWTGVANAMYDAFAAGGEKRNDILKEWKALGGRDSLIMGAVRAANLLVKPIQAVRAAFDSMFPRAKDMGAILKNLTDRFAAFMEKIQPTQSELEDIYKIFKGLFSAGKIVIQIFNAILKAIFPVAEPIRSLVDVVLHFLAMVGAAFTGISRYLDKAGVLVTLTETIKLALTGVLTVLKTLAIVIVGGVFMGIAKLVSLISAGIGKIREFASQFSKLGDVFGKVKDAITDLLKKLGFIKDDEVKISENTKDMDKNLSDASKSMKTFSDTISKGTKPIDKAVTLFDKIKEKIKQLGTIVVGGVVLIGSGIKSIATKIFEFFKSVFTKFSEYNKESDGLLDTIKNFFKAIFDSLGEAGEKIKEFLDNLGVDTSGIEEAFTNIGDAIGKITGKITPGRIAAIALSAALIGLTVSAINLSSKLEGLVTSLTTIFTTVGKILKQKFAKSTTLLDIGKSFALIAGSLALLASLDTGKLWSAVGAMSVFVVIFGALGIVIAKMQKKLDVDVFKKNFNSISKSIIMLSASMAILAASIAILNEIQLEGSFGSWVAKIGIVLTLLLGIVGATFLLTKLNKDLPKATFILLGLALSMKMLVDSIATLAGTEIADIQSSWKAFVGLFGGLSLLLVAAGKVPLGSALSILALAKAFRIITPAITAIADSFKEIDLSGEIDAALSNGWGLILFLGGALAIAGAVVEIIMYLERSKIGKVAKEKKKLDIFSGISGFLLGVGAGLTLIVYALQNLHEMISGMGNGEFESTILALMGIFASVTIFYFALKTVSGVAFGDADKVVKDFQKMGGAMVALGASLVLIAGALKIVSGIPKENLASATVAISALGILVTIFTHFMGDIKKGLPAVVAMVGFTAALGILMGELAIMSLLVGDDPLSFIAPLLALGSLVVMLVSIVNAMSGIKDTNAGPMFALMGTLIAIGTSLVALSLLPIPNVLASMAAMSAVIFMLTGLVATMGKATEGATKASALLALAVTLVALGASLTALATQPWAQIYAAGLMMSLALATITVALLAINKIGDASSIIIAAAALSAVSVSMLAIAGSLMILENVEWGAVGKFVVAIISIGAVLGILAGISTAFPLFAASLTTVSIALVVASAGLLIGASAFMVFALAIPILADGINQLTPALQNFATIPFAEIAIGLGELTLGIGSIALACAGLGVGSLGLIAFAGALIIFNAALTLIGENISKVVEAMDKVGGALGNAATSIKEKFDGIKQSLSDFKKSISDAFSNTFLGKVIQSAADAGKSIAGDKATGTGFLGGLAKVLKWHSPLGVIKDMLADAGLAFSNNQEAISAAQKSGSEIGTGFGSKLLEKVSQYVTKIKGWLKQNLPEGIVGEGGVLTEIIDAGKEQVEEFTGLLEEDFTPAVEESGDASEEAAEGVDDLSEALEGAGGSAKGAASDLDDFVKTVRDKLAGIDIFSKFEAKTELSAEQMLENMKSNLDGIASWTHRMAVLAARGLDKELLKKLGEMGVSSYEQVNAFINMTDEQLQEANQMFQTSLALPDKAAEIIGDGFKYAGSQAVEGWEGALRDHFEDHEAVVGYADSQVQAFKDAIGVASPSTVFYEMGAYCIEGFRLGLLDPSVLVFLNDTINLICTWQIIQVFKDILTYEEFYNIGINLDYGLRDGINAGAEEAYAAARTVAETVVEIMKVVPQVESPSKVTRRVGFFISEGLAIGISDGAENVYNASQQVAENGINGIESLGGRIQDAIDELFVFSPTITPTLDLSYMKKQMDDVNSMFGDETYTAQNGGNLSNQPQTITFTQNNYSPKSLSRYEIYRQTSRQLSSIRKVVTG